MATLEVVVEGKDNASGVFRSVGSALERMGGVAGGILAANVFSKITDSVIGVGTEALNLSKDLEAQMSNVQAVMMASDAEIASLKTLISDLGVDPNLKVSTMEAADAIEMLGRNGLKTDEILQGAARATVLLSNSTGGDFAQSADIATDVMALWNIEAGDMMSAVDGITSVVTNSKFSIDDFALALAQGGGVAASVGVEFDDFTTAIAGMAPLFKSGSDAGTSFKTFLQRLTPMTGPAAEAMNELGLLTADGASKFFDAAGNMKSMAEIAGILQEATADLSEEERIAALSTIFGTDAMRAAVGVAKLGEEGFNNLQATMSKTDAVEAAAMRMDNLAGSMEILDGIVETIRVQIGDAFNPIVRQMVDLLAEHLGNTGPNTIAFFENLANAISVGMGAASDWINTTGLPAFYAMSNWFNQVALPVLTSFSGFLSGTVVPALESLGSTVAQIVMNRMETWGNFLSSTLMPNLQALGEWFGATGVPAIQEFAGFISTTVLPALVSLDQMVSQTIVAGLELAINSFNSLTTMFQNTTVDINEVRDTFAGVPAVITDLQTTVDNFVTGFKSGLSQVMAYYGPTWGRIVEGFGGFITNLEPLKPAWDEFMGRLDAAMPGLELLAGYIGTALIVALKALGELLAVTLPVAGQAFTDMFTFIMDVVGGVVEFIGGSVEMLTGLFTNDLDQARVGAEKVFNGIKAIAEAALGPVTNAIDRMKNSLSGIADSVPDWMIPGSPTPFEVGLLGIANAMSQLTSLALPDFGLQSMTQSPAGDPATLSNVTNLSLALTSAQVPAMAFNQSLVEMFTHVNTITTNMLMLQETSAMVFEAVRVGFEEARAPVILLTQEIIRLVSAIERIPVVAAQAKAGIVALGAGTGGAGGSVDGTIKMGGSTPL